MSATTAAIVVLSLALAAMMFVHSRARAAERAVEREMKLMREYLLWLETRLANVTARDFDMQLALRLSNEISRVSHSLAARQGIDFNPPIAHESRGAAQAS